jgi:hypothetical protein
VWWSQRGCRYKKSCAFTCWVSMATCAKAHAHAHAPAPTPTSTHTHACTHPCAYTHTMTLTPKYVILIIFPRQKWFRECVSVLLNTYIAFLVVNWSFVVLGWAHSAIVVDQGNGRIKQQVTCTKSCFSLRNTDSESCKVLKMPFVMTKRTEHKSLKFMYV